MTYSIEFTEAAKKQLLSILDRRIREKILERAQELANEPEKQGKELGGDLEGCRSVRAVGQRYRILYRIDGEKVVVIVVAVGIRKEGDKKDVYKLAQRLYKLGLLEEQQIQPEVEIEVEQPLIQESSETTEEKEPED